MSGSVEIVQIGSSLYRHEPFCLLVIDLHRLLHLDGDDIAGAKRSMQLESANSGLSMRKLCSMATVQVPRPGEGGVRAGMGLRGSLS